LKGKSKLDCIQYLRALAAAAVVVSHAGDSLLGHESHLINLEYGAYGVDIFFVVSGFIMLYTTIDTQIGPATFLMKRLIRIFPLYFILSTAMFVLTRLHPASFNRESPDAIAFLESIFFVPHWNPREHNLEPLIGQGWTLNYEMFFYLLFAGTLVLGQRFRGLFVLLPISALVAVGQLHPIEVPAFITYTSPLLLEFGLGVICAACLLTRRTALAQALLIILALLTVYLYAFHADSYRSETLRPLFIGAPCALLMTVLVMVEGHAELPRIRPLILIGDASYSLYLVHGFVLGFGRRLWLRYFDITTLGSNLLFVIFILLASIAVAIPLYRYIEVKLGRALSGLLTRREPSTHRVPV